MFPECSEELFFFGLRQFDVKACAQSIECVHFDVMFHTRMQKQGKSKGAILVKYV